MPRTMDTSRGGTALRCPNGNPHVTDLPGLDGRCGFCRTFDDTPERREDEPCERGTVGCCVHHRTGDRTTAERDTGCETW